MKMLQQQLKMMLEMCDCNENDGMVRTTIKNCNEWENIKRKTVKTCCFQLNRLWEWHMAQQKMKATWNECWENERKQVKIEKSMEKSKTHQDAIDAKMS